MENVFDTLRERGFIEQATHEEEIREMLGKEPVTFYIGFDPTADSLHVGHFIQIMVMMHMQRAGHRPIAILGSGTGMVGDPSGRTDMRKMLTIEEIEHNVNAFKGQLSRFVDFSDGKALLLSNGDWLRELNYIELLRDIGVHFSVNRMLSFECFKSRYERGLSFIEFNYMIMQAYDFLYLNRHYNCKLQFGGNDQWSNIIAGVELIRRADGNPAYGLTFKLLTNSEGKKMGKTANGAVWLDPQKTTPFDFYQYWRNIDDADVEKCLSLLTFLPMEEVRRLGGLEGAEINHAKEVLAYEVTALVHGTEAARAAQQAAKTLFGQGGDGGNIPHTELSPAEFENGMDVITLLRTTGLIDSSSEGRRLIEQGGLTIEEQKITDIKHLVHLDDFNGGKVLIKKGKKSFHQVILK